MAMGADKDRNQCLFEFLNGPGMKLIGQLQSRQQEKEHLKSKLVDRCFLAARKKSVRFGGQALPRVLGQSGPLHKTGP